MRRVILVTAEACILTLLAVFTCEADYITASNGLRLRTSPAASGEVVEILPYGTEVDVEYRVNPYGDEWLKIDGGYVKAEYVSGENPFDGYEYMGDWHITAYAYTGSPCANGNYPQTGYTIACNSLPFGTEVYIDGIGFRTVEDRGPEWLGSEWADVYMGDVQSCVNWGSQSRGVWLVK